MITASTAPSPLKYTSSSSIVHESSSSLEFPIGSPSSLSHSSPKQMVTPEASMKTLMETLQSQQELLQQLYTEIDVEREASAIATNESLSMILRLQGEKAAVEMESGQYKRIAEQKMFYAEETLETFRDLIYQKEMQIASLEFQVQAFKFKLISLGCKDVGEIEASFPQNMLSRGNSLPKGQGVASRAVRRGCSLPPNFLEDEDDPPVSSNVLLPETTNSDLGQSKSGDFTSYWQQIKRLDERVKELSVSKDVFDSGNKMNEMGSSYSLHSQSSSSSLRGRRTPGADATEVSPLLLDMEPREDSASPSKILDIFEVPQAPNGGEFQIKEKGESSSRSEFRPPKPDSIKTVISGVMDKSNWNQRPLVSSDVFPKPRDGVAVEQLQFKRPDVTDFELQQMNRRLKRLEDEKIVARQETTPRQQIANEEDDEKVMLLKDIKDQLNSIEDEILSWKPKKRPPKKEEDPTCLKEAILHFWS